MALRQSCALNLTPLFLRLSLGITFIWAGSAKLFFDQPFAGESAAVLANLGVKLEGPHASPGEKPKETPEPAAEEPAVPATPPVEENPSDTEPAKPSPDEPAPSPVEEPAPSSPPALAARDNWFAPPAVGVVMYQASASASRGAKTYTADDFPEPLTTLRLYGLSVMLHNASQPDDKGRVAWPAALATPPALRLLPWFVAVTELLGGVLVLLGFMTRIWAFALAGTMIVALWLTQIYPAWTGGGAFLWVLPQPMLSDPAKWSSAWEKMLFQFALLMIALGLAFSGAGRLSMDGWMFRPTPKAPPKPAPAA